jgi:hypothetical protein
MNRMRPNMRLRNCGEVAMGTVPTPSDSLFSQLDGRIVRVGSAGWRVEVFSVWIEEVRWLQIGLKGPSEHMLTLRVPLAATAVDILDEVDTWLRTPSEVLRASDAGVRTPPRASTTVH